MSPKFIHLHLHTEYSIVDGIVKIEELIAACGAAQMPAVAVTDQGNLFSLIKFYRAATAAGIKPIIGVDVWLQNERETQTVHQAFKLVLLAQNHNGYQNIIKLISRSYLHGQKFGKPLVHRAWLEECCDGVIVLSGGMKGDVGIALLQKDLEATKVLIQWWQNFFPDRFYLELQRTGRVNEEEYIAMALALAEKYDLPVVATNDVCFLNPDDFEAHEARFCINASYVLDDQQRPRPYGEQQYLRTPKEMSELFADIPEALINTVEIAKRCNVAITLGKNFLPIYPIPENLEKNITVEQYLERKAQRGLATRLAAVIQPAALKLNQYQERLQYELAVINQMGFASYFLIVADFIHWAKQNGVPVGPGRGSGAGSLVAYVLGITDLDPIVHDLLFERFLNPERVSLPDFDIDFCMEGRDRVIEYVVNCYGRDKVAQIITYGTMAARAVVRDVGRVLGYPYGFVDQIAKLIPFELGITLDVALKDEEQLRQRYHEEEEVKTLIDLAKKLEGIVRNAGKHAGGVVIAPSHLTDFMPLYREEGDVTGNVVTQFDKDDVEAVGLVKFDFLGLRTLTIINSAVQTINERRAQQLSQQQPPLDITTIPLDDMATYELLRNCSTIAVFQLESRGMSELVKKLKPDCFDEIVALVALYRPGPLQSGMVDDFLNRKHGHERVTYLHSALEPILRSTYGVILYQEQVMQIAQVLAGYSLGSADILRRAMGKKKPEEMAKQRVIFLDGAVHQGIDKHVANIIFDLMEKFAGYGFNKSHSAAYALIAYQTAWLKAHYPAEFMAAVLSSDMDKTEKIVPFVRECENLGLLVKPPEINDGEYRFAVKRITKNNAKNDDASVSEDVDGDVIVYGLGAIKGVGLAAIENICSNRASHGAFLDLFDFCRRIDHRKVNKRALEALIDAGAFDKIAPNRASLFASLSLAMRFAEQSQRLEISGQMDLLSLLEMNEGADQMEAESEPYRIDYVVVPEWPEEEKLKREKDVLGFYLSGHPLEHHQTELKKFVTANIANLTAAANQTVVIAGLVMRVKLFNTKNGNRLAVVGLEDHTGNIDLTIFSELYTECRDYLQEGQLLVAEAEIGVDNFSGGVRALALNIFTLEEAQNKYAKYLMLILRDGMINDDLMHRLQQILTVYRGGLCPICVSYNHATAGIDVDRGIGARIKFGATWQVRLQDSLMRQLRELLGVDNVVIQY